MDSVDLLARENEFKKLNKQLEKKTESLMKEIEEVMQKPDIFSTPNLKLYSKNASEKKHSCNFSPPSEESATIGDLSSIKPKKWKNKAKIVPNLKNSPERNLNKEQTFNHCVSVESFQACDLNSAEVNRAERVVCDCCVKEAISDELEFLYAFVSVSVKDNILPKSFLNGKVSVASVCKCLSAKIKLMQEQLDKLESTMDKKNKQCEAHLTHIAELESERLTLMNTANTMKSETADMKAKYLAIQNRLNDKERLYKEQRSATDKLTGEIKQYRSKNSSLEARCASQEEALAALRQQLETAKQSEKEYRNATRSLSSSHEATIRQLEARLAAARARHAQMCALVTNLRAQRTLVGAERAVQSLNAQYCLLLEQGQ